MVTRMQDYLQPKVASFSASTTVKTMIIAKAKSVTTAALKIQTVRILVDWFTRSTTQPKDAKTGVDIRAVGTPKNKLTIIEPGIWNSELNPMLIISWVEKTETLTAVTQEITGNMPPYINGNPRPNKIPRNAQLNFPRGQYWDSYRPGINSIAIIDPNKNPTSVTVM